MALFYTLYNMAIVTHLVNGMHIQVVALLTSQKTGISRCFARHVFNEKHDIMFRCLGENKTALHYKIQRENAVILKTIIVCYISCGHLGPNG